MKNISVLCSLLLSGLWTTASAQDKGNINSPEHQKLDAAFDIIQTEVKSVDDDIIFRVQTRGKAGTTKPAATGKFAGSAVYSYVWPTSLDSGNVGFDTAQGILALAVTFHPDFNDGAYGQENSTVWHPHWVVLMKDEACGSGALKVRDIPKGTNPKLPPTWPNVPLLIDSPSYATVLEDNVVEVTVPASSIGATAGMTFDGVTAALQVNANLHAPLLCISDVFDIASGNLSLPGKIVP